MKRLKMAGMEHLLRVVRVFFFISYLASPQIEMCHCRRKVEHKHKCSFIRKQKHTDKQEDDENSFSGEIKFKLKLMQMRTTQFPVICSIQSVSVVLSSSLFFF